MSMVGCYTPFMIVGGAIAAIAAGVMSTLTPTATAALWVSCQLLNGIACGMLSQQAVTVVQANLPKEQLSIGAALVVLCQNFGASVFISLGQTTFENSLLHTLRKSAPDVDPRVVMSAGATNFRDIVPKLSVNGVVMAYNTALTFVS